MNTFSCFFLDCFPQYQLYFLLLYYISRSGSISGILLLLELVHAQYIRVDDPCLAHLISFLNTCDSWLSWHPEETIYCCRPVLIALHSISRPVSFLNTAWLSVYADPLISLRTQLVTCIFLDNADFYLCFIFGVRHFTIEKENTPSFKFYELTDILKSTNCYLMIITDSGTF